MTLPHTHEGGKACLACALDSVRSGLPQFDGFRHHALDRITAALARVSEAEREHLERGAELLASEGCVTRDRSQEHRAWLRAERARKAKRDGE